MNVYIIEADLFTTTRTLIAYCISADLIMSCGIALQFIHKYGRPSYERTLQIGDIVVQHSNSKIIYHLITKKYYDKPTIYTLELALKKLVSILPKESIVAISKLRCGLDRLDWNSQVYNYKNKYII